MERYFKTALLSTLAFGMLATASAFAADPGNIMHTLSEGSNINNRSMGSSADDRTPNRLPSDSGSRATSSPTTSTAPQVRGNTQDKASGAGSSGLTGDTDIGGSRY